MIAAGYAEPPLKPIVEIKAGTRRRMDLAVRRVVGGVMLGLHRFRSDDVIDMHECALLEPLLVSLLPPLRVLLTRLDGLRRSGSVIVNRLDDGADILLRLDAELSVADRAKLLSFAKENGILRVSAAKNDDDPELIAMLAPPVITLSGTEVKPPPGAFLQPSRDGEAAIIGAVLAGMPKPKSKMKIVELFAGIGTLSFALAKHGSVEAYEGSAPAVAALDEAIRANGFAGRMRAELRNLARRPLQAKEMAGRAVLVLDPPYMGAGFQMPFIASAKVPCVIYVSCNPLALQRDALLLQRAGYGLASVTPIDQFPFSENLESVTVFQLHK